MMESLEDFCTKAMEDARARSTFPCATCGAVNIGAREGVRCEKCSDAEELEDEREHRASWAPPRYRWARSLEAPELSTRLKDPKAIALALAAVAERPRSIVLFGPAGVGKTSVAVAIANALSVGMGPRPVFVDATVLATARARCRLGEEAEAVAAALGAHLLLIDEIGRGVPNATFDALPEILMTRHNNNKASVFTTPCASVEELKTRLGDAGLARRVLEGARTIFMKVGAR